MKKMLILAVVLLLLPVRISEVRALDELDYGAMCRDEIASAVYEISGFVKTDVADGYSQRMRTLLGTSVRTSEVIEEAKQLARDARLEFESLCFAVSRFDRMTVFESEAYGFYACNSKEMQQVEERARLVTFCYQESSKFLEVFLQMIPLQLTYDAMEESMRLLTDAYRRFNSKFEVLLNEYKRVVDNLFLLNQRLGNYVVTDSD